MTDRKVTHLLLAAEWGSGQVLWSLLWFFLFFVWIMLIFTIFGDIIRSQDMGGWAKAIWSIFIIFLPFLGIFIYLIARGGGMGERQVAAAQRQNEQMQEYIRATTASGGTSDAEQLAKLADLHTSGKLDDAEYAAAKAKVIS
jgi:Phospholipase_D-nuclease N-terminal